MKKPANPRIPTVNGGSSSIKFALFETGDSLRRTLEGGIERIGLPEANLLSVMNHCLKSRDYVNVVVAGKHCSEGIGIWQWASNDQAVAPDVVMACCGDVPTLETLAAVSILREHLPKLKIRVVNVVDLFLNSTCTNCNLHKRVTMR